MSYEIVVVPVLAVMILFSASSLVRRWKRPERVRTYKELLNNDSLAREHPLASWRDIQHFIKKATGAHADSKGLGQALRELVKAGCYRYDHHFGENDRKAFTPRGRGLYAWIPEWKREQCREVMDDTTKYV